MGISRLWFENGQVAQEIPYQDGVSHGKMAQYYSNGQQSQVGMIVRGKAQGPRKHYLPDGRLYGVSTLVDGQVTANSVQLQISEQDYLQVEARTQWSPRLRSYWD